MQTPEAFVAELERTNAASLAVLDATASQRPVSEWLDVPTLLKLALKNELEATECAAAWLPVCPEVKVKLALARQAGDEAKHYGLIARRLGELGVDVAGYDPFVQGRSPLLVFLLSLETTVERIAAGPFTREALALVRNDAFSAFCRSKGDAVTAALYDDVIQPDERHHHELGRGLLLELCTTEEAQATARAVSAKVLAMAEEMAEIAALRLGLARLPGC
ncbi:MAG: ferritin-like domain-containing protein [Polyangiaceae bacterium]|nr:ferritin-like domain-containing protein [Polyangiaceae bacterium]